MHTPTYHTLNLPLPTTPRSDIPLAFQCMRTAQPLYLLQEAAEAAAEASANAGGGDVGASKMSPMGEAIQRILKELPHITTEELVADTVHYSNIATTLRGAPDYLASMRLWQAAWYLV